MQQKKRWPMVFAIFLLAWGQLTYACEAMDMPAQSVCCCEDHVVGGEMALPIAAEHGCGQLGSKTSPGACCTMEFQSAVDAAAHTLLNADQTFTWLQHAVALANCLGYESRSTLWPPSTSVPPDPDWLLAQAAGGRTVYLSTLRLRI